MLRPTCLFVWYGGLVLALYNYYGLVAPRLSLHNFWFHIYSACFYVLREFPAALSAHRAPGEKAAVPICKVLERPGREANSRPTSTEADALTYRPRAGPQTNWQTNWSLPPRRRLLISSNATLNYEHVQRKQPPALNHITWQSFCHSVIQHRMTYADERILHLCATNF